VRLRPLLQSGFVALTLVGVFVVGGNCERWCPFGGVEAIYTYVGEGNLVCSLGVSNFFILGGVVLATLLLRRAFCGYVCPIGAMSEGIGALATRLHIPRITVAARLDRGLAVLGFVVLGVILWFTWRTSELVFRGYDPCYALIGRHGEDITLWAYVISGVIVVASLVLRVPFCRWFCPLAAVLAPLSKVGLGRVVRDEKTCIDCAACGEVCQMAIPVHEQSRVTQSRCTGCLECVDACPERDGGTLSWQVLGRPLRRPVLVAALLLILAASVTASYLWPLPSFVWTRGELPADEARVELRLENLGCRGNANMLVYFLTRDDFSEIEGPIRLEAWPGPGLARVAVIHDADRTSAKAIRAAITEPYFDANQRRWRQSPFVIEGHDPLAED
jgi:ferredoxin